MDADPIEEIVIGLAHALEVIEDHGKAIRDPALAAWLETVSEQLLTLQTYLTDKMPGEQRAAPREPSPARGSASGTEPLKAGVIRPFPKPGA